MKRIIGAALAALLLATAACTPQLSADPAGDTSESAPAEQTSAPAEQEPQDTAGDAEAGFEEYVNLASNVTTVHMVMKMTGSADTTLEGDLDATDKSDLKMHMTMSMSGQSIEMVVWGGKVYANMAGTWQEMTSMDVDDLTAEIGAKSADTLRDAVKAKKYIGEADIDGSPGHKYEFTLDMSTVGEVVYTVVIANDKKSLQFEFESNGTTTEVTYTKIGEPVSIDKPKI
ncbi:MAG: hypothetical protein LBR58_11815 [Propionibacteriaceae bacterium]|nr:hypothetical protein [Propionibacteriaceae bacterium]